MSQVATSPRSLPSHSGRRRADRQRRLECLEPRFVLAAPTLAAIDDITVASGTSVPIALDGFDADGDTLTFSASSTNDNLDLIIPEGRSIRISTEERDSSGTVLQTFDDMVFKIFESMVPGAAGRILELADSGFYDGVTFHRIIEDFVIQGGDPDGTGSGGSGVTFDDEFNTSLYHTVAGILSMAKGGDDSNDSQFFITAGPTRHLDFNHTIFGFLNEGEDARAAIAAVDVVSAATGETVNTVLMTDVEVFVDPDTGVLIVQAPEGFTGTATITVTVDDGNGGIAQQSFDVTVEADTDENANARPFISDFPAFVETTSGVPVGAVLEVTDVEGDSVDFYSFASTSTIDVGTPNSEISVDPDTLVGFRATTFVPVGDFVGVGLAQLRIRPLGSSGNTSSVYDEHHVAILVNPLAPTSIELVEGPENDGESSTTPNDNAPGRELTFRVSGVREGTTVKIFADGIEIGSLAVPLPNTGDPSLVEVEITTDGLTTLAEGAHDITATVTLEDQTNPVPNLGNFDIFPIDLVSEHSSPLALMVERQPEFTSTEVTAAAPGVLYTYDAQTDEEGTLDLTYSLTESPTGMSIDPDTGVVTWTPTVGQLGPQDVTIHAENTFGNFAEQSFTIDVAGLVVTPIDDITVDEFDSISFTVEASNPSNPGTTFFFSMTSDPAAGAEPPDGAVLHPSTGDFSWTPNDTHGGETYLFTVTVTDQTSAQQVVETFSVTVNAGNTAPTIDPISDQTIDELATLAFTVSASDVDVPAQSLAFALAPGAPNGAAIDPDTGEFSWTPTEADGPGIYPITVEVTDGVDTTTESFQVTVNEVNTNPAIDPIADQTVDELDTLSFTVIVFDPDLPAQNLAFSLAPGAPNGAAIDPDTGEFSWTPTEADGPGVYPITVEVTDGIDTTTESFQVTVNEVNQAPVIEPIQNQVATLGQPFALTANATDADLPADTLTFSVDGGGATGLDIDPDTGEITWTPDVSVGEDLFTITVFVSDGIADPVSTTFELRTQLAPTAPELDPISDQTIDELATLTFTADATDINLPNDNLTFTLAEGAPVAAAIDPSTGEFTWTPSEADGPGVYPITVVVTDAGGLTDTETFQVTVNEVASPPVIDPIDNQSVDENETLAFTVAASDPDLPADTLTFSLAPGAPVGAAIDPDTGEFTFTPDETQGGTTFDVTVQVSDGNTTVTEDFQVSVFETNDAPVLDPIADQTVNEGDDVSLLITASDADLPAHDLAFSLAPGAPTAAAIDPDTGVFTWSTTEADGPGVYDVTVIVEDQLGASDERTFQVTVNEINTSPVLDPIDDQTVDEGETLAFTPVVSDADLPANTLTFSLAPGAPAGAAIDPATGDFTFTPDESQGGTTFDVTVQVTDGTETATQSFQVTVVDTNTAPTLAPIDDRTAAPGDTLTIPLTVADADIPFIAPVVTVDPGAPAGTGIDPATGDFVWDVPADQAPGDYIITLRATDGNDPSLFATQSFTVTVGTPNSILLTNHPTDGIAELTSLPADPANFTSPTFALTTPNNSAPGSGTATTDGAPAAGAPNFQEGPDTGVAHLYGPRQELDEQQQGEDGEQENPAGDNDEPTGEAATDSQSDDASAANTSNDADTPGSEPVSATPVSTESSGADQEAAINDATDDAVSSFDAWRTEMLMDWVAFGPQQPLPPGLLTDVDLDLLRAEHPSQASRLTAAPPLAATPHASEDTASGNHAKPHAALLAAATLAAPAMYAPRFVTDLDEGKSRRRRWPRWPKPR